MIDAHDYGNNLLRQGVDNPVKPKVVGEYGGIALPVPGHTWTQGWGYQTVRDPEGLMQPRSLPDQPVVCSAKPLRLRLHATDGRGAGTERPINL